MSGVTIELSSSVKATVLELSKCDLSDLKPHPSDLVGLKFDIGLLQPHLCTTLLDLLLDPGVLLVDRARIGLQLRDQRPGLGDRKRRIRGGWCRIEDQGTHCHRDKPQCGGPDLSKD